MTLPTSSLAALQQSHGISSFSANARTNTEVGKETRASSSEREKTEQAFNWLQNTMSSLKIGDKDKKGPPLSAGIKSQEITRNTTVFQFPSPLSSFKKNENSASNRYASIQKPLSSTQAQISS